MCAAQVTCCAVDRATPVGVDEAGSAGCGSAPPPPIVAPTRVPTVHSLPPSLVLPLPSLLLPLPVSLLYTPPPLPTVAPTRVPTVHSPPSLLLPLPVSLLYTPSLRAHVPDPRESLAPKRLFLAERLNPKSGARLLD